MTRAQTSQKIRDVVGNGCNVAFTTNQIIVSPPYGMYAEWRVDYDDLKRLSAVLHTTAISFEYREGWVGTEVTPGDATELRLVINKAVP